MDSLVPIVAGAACGVLSAAPYVVALMVQRRRRDASIVAGGVAVVVSLAVLVLSTLFGWLALRASLFVFAVALAVVFLVAVVASVALYAGKPRP